MNGLRRQIGTGIARFLTVPAETPSVLPVDIAALRAMLRPADVILVEGNLRISGVIKTLTKSTWSHATLYVGGEDADCIEADVVEGVRRFKLEDLQHCHMRICRPIGLNERDRQVVVAYAASKLGTLYDLRYIFDLARYLFPLPVPRGWRRRRIQEIYHIHNSGLFVPRDFDLSPFF